MAPIKMHRKCIRSKYIINIQYNKSLYIVLSMDKSSSNCFPVDGNWGPWGSYGECSVTCGKGKQTKTRSCNDPTPENNGTPCYGLRTSTRCCTMEACKSETSLKFCFIQSVPDFLFFL